MRASKLALFLLRFISTWGKSAQPCALDEQQNRKIRFLSKSNIYSLTSVHLKLFAYAAKIWPPREFHFLLAFSVTLKPKYLVVILFFFISWSMMTWLQIVLVTFLLTWGEWIPPCAEGVLFASKENRNSSKKWVMLFYYSPPTSEHRHDTFYPRVHCFCCSTYCPKLKATF